MEIGIANLGTVKYGNVKLEGLTVIAGENDTGKSTIGKTIFAIIKGMNNHRKDFKEDKITEIDEIIDNIYFKFRRITKNSVENNLGFSSSFIYPPKVRREVLRLINLEDFDALYSFINIYLIELEHEAEMLNVPGENLLEINPLLRELRSVVRSLENPIEYLGDSVELALKSEFGNDLNNKFTSEAAHIEYSENGEGILDAYLENNRMMQISYTDTPLELEDATYIESPLIFQLYKTIADAKSFSSKRRYKSIRDKNNHKIPFHFTDLISKMSDSSYYESNFFDFNLGQEFIEEIIEIIDGDSNFNNEIEDFLFSREFESNYYSFGTSNVASGIKSFSIIQMLLKAEIINERSLIIIDEPEIHLHPKWQVKYCELIVKLASKGVKILITSHSPYTIQALKYFSKKYELNNKTHFYLAEKIVGEKQTRIFNVDDDLNTVFKKLSDPLKKLL
ncbi:AAA family ATPase [Lysinibacillus sp. 38-6]|uniref:AAA family ATPase n=1 Tax=Lysinibacillus sp. 38-6 TaxID=3385991 RepID=UPI003908A018